MGERGCGGPHKPYRLGIRHLAGTGLLASAAAQQDAADRQRMVEEIDALLASGTSGVARLSPRARAAMTEVPRHEFVPIEVRGL
jgi:protein-L-isoaspartate(D-aspartate) O-methyltransferase